ncbi:MAG: hypothetical protein U0359_24150 [Byssovorax sp.]
MQREALRRSGRLLAPLPRAIAVVVPLLCAALWASPAAAQSDNDKAAARTLGTQAVEALNAGKNAEALDLASRAEQILHAPTHLMIIGRAQVGLGRLVAARETFLKLTREELDAKAPPAFKRAQADGREQLAAIEPKIASLLIQVEGPAQTKFIVKLDEQPVAPALLGVYRPVDPGKHKLVVIPVGQGPVTASVDLAEAEKKEIKLTIPDAPVPAPVDGPGPKGRDEGSPGFFSPLRIAGLGAGAIGVGGLAVGAVFLSSGSSLQAKADELYDACGQHCTADQQAQIKSQDTDAASKKTIAAIGLIGGGVALAAGVTLIVLGKPKPKPAAASITPWFTGNAAGVSGAF